MRQFRNVQLITDEPMGQFWGRFELGASLRNQAKYGSVLFRLSYEARGRVCQG
jgi:hypothetical protein